MSQPRQPGPFPFERLTRVSRKRLPWLRRASRVIGEPNDIASELDALLGAPTIIEKAPLEHCPAGALNAALSDPLVAIVLEHSSGTLGGRAALELDPGIAARVVDRAFGGEGGTDVPVPVTPISDAERGALAYVAARVVAASGIPFLVRGVVTAPAALAGVLGDDGAAVLPARFWLGDDVGLARLWLPERLLDAVQITEQPTPRSAISEIPLELVLDAAWGTIEQADLAALREGDAVLLDASWLRASANGIEGDVRGRIAGARRMVLRCGLEGDTIRVGTLDVGADPGVTEGSRMETKTETSPIDRAGDAPLEVSVEIARFTMPLAEVAALAPGEVLATGRAIGERVTLRANGKAVATGELVDVDGEVGVRVLSFSG